MPTSVKSIDSKSFLWAPKLLDWNHY